MASAIHIFPSEAPKTVRSMLEPDCLSEFNFFFEIFFEIFLEVHGWGG